MLAVHRKSDSLSGLLCQTQRAPLIVLVTVAVLEGGLNRYRSARIAFTVPHATSKHSLHFITAMVQYATGSLEGGTQGSLKLKLRK